MGARFPEGSIVIFRVYSNFLKIQYRTARSVAWWRSGYGIGLVTAKVAGSTPGLALSGDNLGQVVHTHVPLSPSSIICFRSRGGDVLRPGRAWTNRFKNSFIPYAIVNYQ